MLIKQSDYHRIYKIINTLLVNENANPASASMYFATFGAYILRQHYKLQAIPRCGLAAYNLGGSMLLFADHREDGYVSGAGENFHCWVEVDGWIIDFMAPALVEHEGNLVREAKMFQRRMSDMAPSINELKSSGDFYVKIEEEAAKQRFAAWQKQPMIGDLATIATQWFRKSPKAMQSAINLRDHKDNLTEIKLIGQSLSGSW